MAASFYDDQKKRNQAYALSLLQQGSDASPVQHPLQAVARALQGAVGGYQLGAMEREDKSQRTEANSEMAKLLMGGQQQAAPAMPAMPSGNPGDAIASIESGGKYDALGPVTKTGDRAFGKYQVMGANIGPWAKAHLGQEMTPDQFLANPQAQDAIFKGQFGQYANKYGPEGAARAWFAGEGNMNNLGAKDQLGTTVGQYGQKFAQAAGVLPMAQAAPQPSGLNPQAIAQMLQSPNPYIQQMGQQLAQQSIAQQNKDPLEIEAKRLEIAAKKKQLAAPPEIKTIETEGGKAAVQWDPAKNTYVPFKPPEGTAPANPKLTEQQSKDVGFYNRGQKLLPRLEQQDQALTEAASAAGGMVSNYFKSDSYRQAEQTGKELLAVILRKDTGAAVTPSEMSEYGSIYLPRPGDDPTTIQQKRIARQTAIEGLRMGLGPAEIIFKSREAAEAAKAAPAPAAPAAKPTGKTKNGVSWAIL